jgi:uncharacterized protein (TIGR03086 family)
MTDPRPYLSAALDQTGALLRDVRPEQLDAPTPCTEYDVRRLEAHLLGVVGRIAHVGAGGAPFDVPSIVEGVDDVCAAWDAGRARLDKVWSDDAVLDRSLQAPWGTVPGRIVALGYVQEVLTHGWDLAVATGQRDRLDESLAATCLDESVKLLPAQPRGGRIPFGPVVDVPAEAGAYERLAGWLGRDPAPWVGAGAR